MRTIQRRQMHLGETDPRFLEIDPKNRDKLSQVLLGLQAVYADEKLRQAIFAELDALIPDYKDGKSGRRGMSMWEIFVLAVVRLGCNWDFDTLKNQAEKHVDLQCFLGVGSLDRARRYPVQTIRDCLSILTEEVLAKLNVLIVKGSHGILELQEALEVKGDSFVVLSNVHYPTDINLLLDAMRKSITLVARLADDVGLGGWRKYSYNLAKIRGLFRKTQKMKHSTAKNPVRKQARANAIKECHELYVNSCGAMLDRVQLTLDEVLQIPCLPVGIAAQVPIIRNFVRHGRKQIELIRRRVLEGETVPHHEKIFSIFEEYTEWISKGKAGVSQELGLNICVLVDQYGFILHHRLMQQETDVDVAVAVVKRALKNFHIGSISFDKGFHSPENQRQLGELVERVVLPKKGKLSQKRKEEEAAPAFRQLRYAHSAVESSINSLEHTGLDRCPDRGIHAFRRYIGIGVVARNLKTLGSTLRKAKLDAA